MSDQGVVAVSTRRLSRRYAGVLALDDVTLTVAAGEIRGLVGPNRGGKSTLLRILALRERPSSGSFSLNGIEALRDPLGARQQVGYAGPSSGAPCLTVAEEMRDAARLRGIRRGVGDTIETLLQLVDLADRQSQRLDALSAGEAQRLVLARALVHDPPIVLLDAPFERLDPVARLESAAILRELRALGKTIIITASSVAELSSLCDVISYIDRGRLLYEDAPDYLLGSGGIPIRIAIEEKAVERLVDTLQRRPGISGLRTLDERSVLVWIEESAEAQSALLADLIADGIRVREYSFDLAEADAELSRLARSP